MALHKEEELAKKKCGQSFVTAGTKEVYFSSKKDCDCCKKARQ